MTKLVYLALAWLERVQVAGVIIYNAFMCVRGDELVRHDLLLFFVTIRREGERREKWMRELEKPEL